MKRFIKIPTILAIMTFLCAGLLMLSEALTHEKIAEQQKQLLLTSLEQLIPADLHDNDLITDAITIFDQSLLGHKSPQTMYLGTLNGQFSVAAIPATTNKGYSGDIDIMVGVTAAGEITIVKILAHQETPGLGDLIESRKSDWIQQFPSQSLQTVAENEWQVKKDGGTFDQITGATISPRAVTQAIKQVLLYKKQHFTEQGFIHKPSRNKLNSDEAET